MLEPRGKTMHLVSCLTPKKEHGTSVPCSFRFRDRLEASRRAPRLCVHVNYWMALSAWQAASAPATTAPVGSLRITPESEQNVRTPD